MRMPLSLDPIITDSSNRAERVFTFSKIGQSKLLPSSRRSPRSDNERCATALSPLDHRKYARMCIEEVHQKKKQRTFMEVSMASGTIVLRSYQLYGIDKMIVLPGQRS